MLNGTFVKINRRRPWLKLVIPVLMALAVVGIIMIGASWHQNKDVENLRENVPAELSAEFSMAPEKKVEEVEEEPPHVETREEWLARMRLSKLAALTFDDGPWPDTTNRLLDILKERQAKATFFVLGTRVQAYPDVVMREFVDGHEVDSHTMTHKNLVMMNSGDVAAEIASADRAICGVLQQEMGCVRYVRPPYGNTNRIVAGVVGRPMMGWSIDTLDWKSRDPGEIVANTVNAITDSAVILMHDIYGTTVDAVPGIIDALRAGGYEFVTISELIEIRGEALEPGILYGRFTPRM